MSFFARLVSRVAVVVAALATVNGFAAAPNNDLCANAIVVPASGPFPVLTDPVVVSLATTNGDPALPPIGPCRSGSVSRSIWYRFTPSVTALYTVSTCTDTTTTLDTLMAIYTASGNCTGFSLVDCGDDECGVRAAIETELNAGTTYYIVIWSSGSSIPAGNPAIVQLRISPPPTVPNDTCAGAVVIPDAGPFPYLAPASDTRLAGKVGDPPAPPCAGGALDRSVWYRFNPAASGTYTLSLCGDTGTSVYETYLAMYTAASCSGPFTLTACNDNACEFQSAITTNLTAGTTYYIVAWDPDHTEGESLLQLRVANAVPRITSAARLPNGSYELSFGANVGQHYTVQAAPAITGTWANIGTLSPTSGNAVFTDTNAATFTRRFYRLRSP
jgi:hypothetical protein